VTRDGDEIELTSAEFELLRVLMESRGRALSREAVLRRLRGGEADVYDRSVDMLVSRVRRKLGDDSRSAMLIKTIRGIGYQFVGTVDG
jgi:two-component system response regulator RstA